MYSLYPSSVALPALVAVIDRVSKMYSEERKRITGRRSSSITVFDSEIRAAPGRLSWHLFYFNRSGNVTYHGYI